MGKGFVNVIVLPGRGPATYLVPRSAVARLSLCCPSRDMRVPNAPAISAPALCASRPKATGSSRKGACAEVAEKMGGGLLQG